MHSDTEHRPVSQADSADQAANQPVVPGGDWARAQAAVRQALPHLKDLALYTTLLSPIIVDRLKTASITSGGW